MKNNEQILIDIASFLTDLRMIDVSEQFIQEKVLPRLAKIPVEKHKVYMMEALDYLQELHKEACDKEENKIDLEFITKLLRSKGIIIHD